MLNRIILILICIISISWISYIGYDIYFQKDRLNPELIFNKEDTNLLIINRTDEFPNIKIDFQWNVENQSLIQQFISVPRNERIFISQNRPIILIESPNYWNLSSVITYLNRKGIQYRKVKKDLEIGDFKLTFKYHYLLIAPKNFGKNHTSVTLPKWDPKASAVVLHSFGDEGSYTSEIYLKDQGEIIYQISNIAQQNDINIDDKTLFAPFLPANIENYHFYETNFAIINDLILKNEIISEWLDNGFVQFDYNGTAVLMTDSKLGEDPLNSINERWATDTSSYKENDFIPNLILFKGFSANKNGLYFSRVGDKSIFSTSLDVNKRIIADFELGNTLQLNESKSDYIYGNLPYKVAERKVSKNDKYAVTNFKNKSIKYFIDVKSQQKVNATTSNPNKPFVLPTEGEIRSVLGRGNQQYIYTSVNKFYALNNGKLSWQKSIDGTIIGQPKIVDYEGNGKTFLLLNTQKSVYLFSEAGDNLLENSKIGTNGFGNEVNLYRWKNIAYLVYIDKSKKVVHQALNNNFIKFINHSSGNTQKIIDVFVQNGRVIGVIRGDQHTQTIDLSKDRVLKNYPVIPNETISLKEGGKIRYFGYQNGKFISFDYTSRNQNTLEELPNFSQFKSISINNKTFLSFISYQKLHLFDALGNKIKTINLPSNDISNYDIYFNGNQFNFGFVDDLQNKITVTDGNGKIIKGGLEGKNIVFLSFSKSQLNILTEGNGYAVQYYGIR